MEEVTMGVTILYILKQELQQQRRVPKVKDEIPWECVARA